jgi:DNA modification methylase
MSRQGIPDYVCTFRKPGKNDKPVSGPFEKFIGDPNEFENTGNMSIDVWQRYASPVWDDIDQSRTLNARLGREDNDTKHLCPLQLDVIERCLELWSNPGDVVLSPFMGVGSEGVMSLRCGRKFIGIELKPSYFSVAADFLKREELMSKTPTLF